MTVMIALRDAFCRSLSDKVVVFLFKLRLHRLSFWLYKIVCVGIRVTVSDIPRAARPFAAGLTATFGTGAGDTGLLILGPIGSIAGGGGGTLFGLGAAFALGFAGGSPPCTGGGRLMVTVTVTDCGTVAIGKVGEL